ncbi:prolactin-inducible protein [Suncus etruscus]|uniref:prolactin-inducible protein n=1 Tax=Suncus etruscus TaxID=109475 RepID=UPI0021103D2A|nr:prolactin-inducible protein [Suncus etruscus]
MQSLRLLSKASQAILILVVCLQLGINNAEESDRRTIIMNMQMPTTVKANEELTLRLQVSTELRECMVIRTYLRSTYPMDTPFNFKYTACLCEDSPRTFYWDFATNRTTKITATVDVVRVLGICPNDKAVMPIDANRFYITQELKAVNYY